MEFDINRVYTSVNADELKIGSKVYISDSISDLEEIVKEGCEPVELRKVRGTDYRDRFVVLDATSFNLAYLISEPEEKKLKWTDLKVGDVIRNKDSEIECLVLSLDKRSTDTKHIKAGDFWLTDKELEEWEKVEDD